LKKKSILRKFGIRSGDKIVAIDNIFPKSEKELENLLKNIRFDNYITLSVIRGYTVYTVQIPLKAIDNSF